MSRDDSSGGWVPLGGGGLSDVSVRRRPRPQGAGPPDKPKHDYLIYGKRISDNSVSIFLNVSISNFNAPIAGRAQLYDKKRLRIQ